MTPRLPIVVRGRKREFQLEAIMDTGFDGDLCLPSEIAVRMGLELVGRISLELADGTRRRRLLYRCEIDLGDETKVVSAFLTSGKDALIGTTLLSNYRLTIDFGADQVHRVTLKRRRR